MNHILRTFARQWIITELLPEHHKLFSLMYGRNDGKRSMEDAEKLTTEEIVNEIPDNKLDWAMQQIINAAEEALNERVTGDGTVESGGVSAGGHFGS